MGFLSILKTLNHQHNATVKKLQEEITSLREEVTRLKGKYEKENEEINHNNKNKNNGTNLIKLVKNTLPPRVISRGKMILNTQTKTHESDAVVLILDIKGFTKLSERFAQRGFDNGIEKFTSVVNSFFTDLIDVIHHHHGQIESFNGDALVIMFFVDESLFPWSLESVGMPFFNPLRYCLQCIHTIRSCGKFTPWR